MVMPGVNIGYGNNSNLFSPPFNFLYKKMTDLSSFVL